MGGFYQYLIDKIVKNSKKQCHLNEKESEMIVSVMKHMESSRSGRGFFFFLPFFCDVTDKSVRICGFGG